MRSNYFTYDEPQPCPYCGFPCQADFVDIGIGMTQCGPYHCEDCGASEIGPEQRQWFDHEKREWKPDAPYSAKEIETGWYDPNKGKRLSPYANTVRGILVDHVTAKAAYNVGMLDEKVLPHDHRVEQNQEER